MRLALAGLLFSTVAHAGSYGGAERVHPGYRVSIDASVGDMSDKLAEARAFDEAKKNAEQRIAKVEPEIIRLVRHFLDGTHPYAGRRALVASDKKEGESVRTELVVHDPVVVTASGQVRVDFFLKKPVTEALANKLAADFALAQLAPGGSLHKVAPYPWDEARLLDQLANRAMPYAHVQLLELLGITRRAEQQVRAIAARDEATLGVLVAQALTATFDGKPIAPATWQRSAKLKPEERARLIRMCVLLLPDARLEAGVAQAKKQVPSGEAGAQLKAWLDGFRKGSPGAP